MEIHVAPAKKSERERDYTDFRFWGQPARLKTFPAHNWQDIVGF